MQFVCENCFSDNELKGLINSQGKNGDCDCCKNKDAKIISIEELLDFFKELFENFQPKEKGQSLLSLLQGQWSLFSKHEFGHKVLNDVLNKISTPFSSSEELVDFSSEIIENVNYWSTLKEQLKWEKRYFTDINLLTDDLGWDSFFESKVLIKEEDVFYRARLHQNANEDIYPLDKMSCPPAKDATAGRANPIGIPYLYLSDNQETILYEIRASFLDEVSVATFKKSDDAPQEIFISDFTETPTLYHPNSINKRIKSTLLKQVISRDLSKPMRRYDSELDYIPTQFICEFIKVFTNVQGIKFRSSLHNIGNNLVVFNSNLMKCVDVRKVKISRVNITSTGL